MGMRYVLKQNKTTKIPQTFQALLNLFSYWLEESPHKGLIKHPSLITSIRTDSALLGAEPLPLQLALDTQPCQFVCYPD